MVLWLVLWLPRCAVVKNPPASAEETGDVGLIPGWERSAGEGHGILVLLAPEIPQTEEPGGLQSIGSQGVGHD